MSSDVVRRRPLAALVAASFFVIFCLLVATALGDREEVAGLVRQDSPNPAESPE